MMLRPFWRASARTIAGLYGAIVAQARSPVFYASYGVPDTVPGRFDLIVLHLVLVLYRLDRTPAGRRAGQALFDAFCRDLDDNLREMGVGDLAVPKEMRRFAGAFYGRQAAYVAALAAPGRDFENAIARNIFQVGSGDERAVRLAAYARRVLTELDARNETDLLAGNIAFPSPEAFADE
jgi:cytochrome b pre-mRNA-processing protein 3